jgi:hypothetical protein
MFENDYLDNFYMSNLNPEDYNLDVKEKEKERGKDNFQDSYYHIFNPESPTHDEFLENFMKIDYDNAIVIKSVRKEK